jgi:hypothetical protein
MPITEAEWKQRYYDLVEKMKSEGYNVTYKGDNDLLDYAGMNYEAAKAMDYDRPIKRNEVQLARGMTWEKKYKTLWHEYEQEIPLMKKNGGKYFPAHRISTIKEGSL